MASKDFSGFSEFVPSSLVLLGFTEMNYLIATIYVLLLFALLKGLYNRYLHPLRQFPGPFWGSVTDFYKLYVVSKMDAHTRGLEMHKRYGQYKQHQLPIQSILTYHLRAHRSCSSESTSF